MRNVSIPVSVPEMLIALLEITREFVPASQDMKEIHMEWHAPQVRIAVCSNFLPPLVFHDWYWYLKPIFQYPNLCWMRVARKTETVQAKKYALLETTKEIAKILAPHSHHVLQMQSVRFMTPFLLEQWAVPVCRDLLEKETSCVSQSVSHATLLDI